jgi:glycosyltransferase involved in cell wall biosynthesis
MNKRLLIAVTTDLNTDQRMQKTALSLHRAGYQVHLVGRQLPHSQALRHTPYTQSRLNMWFHKGPLFYAEYNFRLWLMALKAPVDAYTAVDTDTLVALRLVAIVRRKPLIWDAHEIFTGVPELSNRPWVRGIWQLIEKLFLPSIPYSYTVSEGVAEWYTHRHGLRMQLVYNMPLSLHASTDRGAMAYLLYQGAVNVGRGLPTLLQTMSRHHLPLVIAGGGDILSDLKEMAHQLKLEDRVQFTGLLNPDSLKELTRDAFIGFNLLDGDSLNYRHSLANRFFDFVQAGIPQIGMNFEGYRRFNQQFEVAILLDQVDPDSVAEAILRLVNEPGLYNRLREQCRLASKCWSWEASCEPVLLSIYGEALPL